MLASALLCSASLCSASLCSGQQQVVFCKPFSSVSLVYQVLVDVFSTTPSSFRFYFWWTFFGGRLVSHLFWWTFFGGRLVGHFFGGHNLNDLFN